MTGIPLLHMNTMDGYILLCSAGNLSIISPYPSPWSSPFFCHILHYHGASPDVTSTSCYHNILLMLHAAHSLTPYHMYGSDHMLLILLSWLIFSFEAL